MRMKTIDGLESAWVEADVSKRLAAKSCCVHGRIQHWGRSHAISARALLPSPPDATDGSRVLADLFLSVAERGYRTPHSRLHRITVDRFAYLPKLGDSPPAP